MIDRILTLIKGAPDAPIPEDKPDDLRLAVAALLVEAACRDDTFDQDERDAIEQLVTDKFELSKDETHELIESAHDAQKESNQLYGFTRGMVQKMEYEERVHLIEMLWDVAYADGVLDPHEDTLIRRIAGLIYVTDRDRGAAKRRAIERRASN
jgi:uncharacterized tellurite resistance protein B-like protein